MKLTRNVYVMLYIIGSLFTLFQLQAQGITFLSNLGQTATGNLPIGSDSWLAIPFITGNNTSGYTFNSIQFAMTDATGNPSDFTVSLDTGFIDFISPGSTLGTLKGSMNPVAGGIYTFTTASSITLLSGKQYFIVLTAGTAVANGAYDLNYAGGFSYDQNGNWYAGNVAGGTLSISTDGSSWQQGAFIGPQYAITAAPIPEPSSEMLLGLGGILLLGYGGWKAKAAYNGWFFINAISNCPRNVSHKFKSINIIRMLCDYRDSL